MHLSVFAGYGAEGSIELLHVEKSQRWEIVAQSRAFNSLSNVAMTALNDKTLALFGGINLDDYSHSENGFLVDAEARSVK